MVIETCPFTAASNHDHSLKKILGSHNLVAIHQCRKDEVDIHTAPLSIKYTLRGTETYHCDKQALQVDPDRYLIINKSQEYSSSINSSDLTTSLCVFFADSFVGGVYNSLVNCHEALLDNPVADKGPALYFHQKLQYKQGQMTYLLDSFYIKYHTGYLQQQLALDEWYYDIACLLLQHYHTQQHHISQIETAKPSTRLELYKRLSRAVDYINAAYHTPVSLQDLSKVSFLSPFYLHRAFKECFHTTPYAYLTRLRLRRSLALLAQTNDTVKDVCFASGFEDTSSFIRLFKTHYGVTPAAYRKELGQKTLR